MANLSTFAAYTKHESFSGADTDRALKIEQEDGISFVISGTRATIQPPK